MVRRNVWSALYGFALCGCLEQGGVYTAEDSKMLPEAERAVMLQPKRGFMGPRGVWLHRSGDKTFDERYSYFSVPSRLELSPGNHWFFYDGGNSWTTCFFALEMQAGHVYQPKEFPYPQRQDSIASCMSTYCLLDLAETSPDGNFISYPIFCGGSYEMKLMSN